MTDVDVDHNMTRPYQDVVTCLENTSTNTLVQVWCGAHQLDLGIGEIFRIVVKYQVYSVTTVFISYLGRKLKIIDDMGNIFPCVVNRWLLTSKLTKWFNLHHINLKAYIT